MNTRFNQLVKFTHLVHSGSYFSQLKQTLCNPHVHQTLAFVPLDLALARYNLQYVQYSLVLAN